MLEPQSTALFILLIVVFCALVCWMALARQMVFRVFAACLAFIPAMLFGVAAVNKYYDYYQTWGAVAADLGARAPGGHGDQREPRVGQTGQRDPGQPGEPPPRRREWADHPPHRPRPGEPPEPDRLRLPAAAVLPAHRSAATASRSSSCFRGSRAAPRTGSMWSASPRRQHPARRRGPVKPAVLVMPDANGGRRISLQCLNVRHGPQDATYLAQDLSAYLSQFCECNRRGRPGGSRATPRAASARPTWPWSTGCDTVRPGL